MDTKVVSSILDNLAIVAGEIGRTTVVVARISLARKIEADEIMDNKSNNGKSSCNNFRSGDVVGDMNFKKA